MKICTLFYPLLLVFFLHLQAIPQEQEEDRLLRYPRKALAEAEEMHRRALHSGDSSLLFRSLLQKVRFTIELDGDQTPACIREVEDALSSGPGSLYACLLHSFAAQLYAGQYSRERFSIDRRSPLADNGQEDIDRWDTRMYRKRILSHARASLTPSHLLQQCPIDTLPAILEPEKGEKTLRPTLYDLLCHRAVDILTHSAPADRPVRQSCTDSLMADADIFAASPLPPDCPETAAFILDVYRSLLDFHRLDGNRDAFLAADLGRLDYVRRHHHPSARLYRSRLEQMLPAYAGRPVQVEILARLGEQLLQEEFYGSSSYRNDSLPYDPGKEEAGRQVLELCRKGQAAYPGYPRIGLLEDLVFRIRAPQLQARFPRVLYPGEALEIRLKTRNIPSCSVEIFRSASTAGEEGRPETVRYSRQSYSLPSRLSGSDTLIRLELPACGLYRLEISCPGSGKKISGDIFVTRLFTLHNRIRDSIRIAVCDWESGLPVPDVRLVVSREEDRRGRGESRDTLVTGCTGTATLQAGPEGICRYRARSMDCPDNPVRTIYGMQNPEQHETRCRIFTDRGIYRPGQPMYYKGYLWSSQQDRAEALEDREVEIVLRDANYREIRRGKARSNRFGTFCGTFILPSGLLNGRFYLSAAGTTTGFEVAEYKRPAFELDLQPERETYHRGDTVRLVGRAATFNGIALQHRTVAYSIELVPFFFRFGEGTDVEKGTTVTDGKGAFYISTVAGKQEAGHFPHFCRITAKVTDSNGETQTGTVDVPVWPDEAQPVLEIPDQVEKDADTAFRIRLDNLPAGDSCSIRYSLCRLKSPTSPETPQDTVVVERLLDTTVRTGNTATVLPDLKGRASGAYLFTVTSGRHSTGRIFHLYSSRDRKPPVPTFSWLEREKTSCHPGGKFSVRFGTSLSRVKVHYGLYNDRGTLLLGSCMLTDEVRRLEFPWKREYGRRLWLEIHYVRNKRYVHETVPLQVLGKSPELQICSEVFRDRLDAGTEEEWRFKVTDADGKPADAELWGLMYDASLDRLTGHSVVFQPLDRRIPAFPYPLSGQEPMYRNNWDSMDSWDFRDRSVRAVPDFRFYGFHLFGTGWTSYRDKGYRTEVLARNMAPEQAAPDKVQAAGKEAQGYLAAGAGAGLRQAFHETAFHCPELRTDSKGRVSLHFRVPESMTRWKFILQATTPEMQYGKLERSVITSRPLLVRPHLPRFFRSGDSTLIQTAVSNLAGKGSQGICRLVVFRPENGEILHRDSLPFRLAAGESRGFTFPFKVPGDLQTAGIRLTAGDDRFLDGEQHLVAVLPDRITDTETLPIFMNRSGSGSWTMKCREGSPLRLTLELSPDPSWYALTALPQLAEPRNTSTPETASAWYAYAAASALAATQPQVVRSVRQWKQDDLHSPLEKNPDLKSILLEASPWVAAARNETESMQQLERLLDADSCSRNLQRLQERLDELQNSDGGWPWFKGMASSPYQTLNILVILARGQGMGVGQEDGRLREMQLKALRYVDLETERQAAGQKPAANSGILLYLYCRSLYRDVPLGSTLEVHRQLLGKARRAWERQSLYGQALLAVTLCNYGQEDEGREIVESLRQYARLDAGYGMYWPNVRTRNGLSPVRTQCTLMEAFRSAGASTSELEAMQLWLLRQKQVQSWGDQTSSTDAVHAILGGKALGKGSVLEVSWGGRKFRTGEGTRPAGYVKQTLTGAEIRPEDLKVEVSKQDDGPVWGGLYLQYLRPDGRSAEQTGELSVDKELFVVRTDSLGQDLLHPLEGERLAPGDVIRVRLTLRLTRDMDFLHLEDRRAACLEPSEAVSGYSLESGIPHYRDVRDASTHFFFERLAAGIHTLEYDLKVGQRGSYRDGAAILQSAYAPEFRAVSRSTDLRVP